MKESHGINHMISKNRLIDWMREFKERRYRERVRCGPHILIQTTLGRIP